MKVSNLEGEDTDFGLQLRNCGANIFYFPEIHDFVNQAPIGGFRIKPAFRGKTVDCSTIMLYKKIHVQRTNFGI
jgi:hypothetical protein